MQTRHPRASIVLAALLAWLPLAANADQFAYLDLQQAMAALDALEHAPREVQGYCAPCGDAAAQRIAVRDLGIARVWDAAGSARPYDDGAGNTYWEIEVNGAGIDLAYVYVRTPAGWENLALRLGLEASDVPRMIPDPGVAWPWVSPSASTARITAAAVYVVCSCGQ